MTIFFFLSKFRYFLSKKSHENRGFQHIFLKILQSILPYSHDHFFRKTVQKQHVYYCAQMLFLAHFMIFLWNLIMIMVWFYYFFYVHIHVMVSFFYGKINLFCRKKHTTYVIFLSLFLKLFTKKSMLVEWLGKFLWNHLIFKLQ